MEYPGSLLTKKIRTIFLISCILLFFIIAPIIILMAAGYRYDWQAGFLRENGAVSIDVKPSSAIAFLDSVKIQDKMPIRLASITPRKYKVQITNLNLIKKSTFKQINKRGTANLILSTNGKFLAFSTLHKGGGFDIYTINVNKNTETLVAFWPGNEEPQISWSLKENFLAVSATTPPYQKILTINTDNGQKWEVIAEDNLPIEKYQWQNTIEPEIYYSTKQDIYSARCLSQKSAVIGQDNFLDWVADEGKVWTMNYNSSTEMLDITEDAFGFAKTFASINDSQYKSIKIPEWQMYLLKNNTLILKSNLQPKMLIINQNSQKLVNGTKAKISPYENIWLFWTPWELNTYKIGEEPYLLVRSENQLQNVLPLDQFDTIALIWNNKVTALYPYFEVTQDMLDEKLSASVIDNQNKKIYYSIDKKTNSGIWSLEY